MYLTLLFYNFLQRFDNKIVNWENHKQHFSVGIRVSDGLTWEKSKLTLISKQKFWTQDCQCPEIYICISFQKIYGLMESNILVHSVKCW